MSVIEAIEGIDPERVCAAVPTEGLDEVNVSPNSQERSRGTVTFVVAPKT